MSGSPSHGAAERLQQVAVCALTFKRPAALSLLLEGLARLRLPDGVVVKGVIVDNDPSASGRPAVEAGRAGLTFPLLYVVEDARGIVAGRNRAVSVAKPFDLLAFIDDDEVPSPQWLEELIRVQRHTGADIVTGAVVAAFDQPPPGWMIDGAFFDRPRHGDGELIGYARTSNALIAAPVLERHRPPFDPAYGLSGGEDTHFFMRAVMEGSAIAWADSAVVVESFPPERVSWRWLLAREYRRGQTLSHCLLDLADSPWRRVRRVANASICLSRGFVGSPLALLRGKAALLRSGRRVALGLGMLTGLTGSRFSPYSKGHA